MEWKETETPLLPDPEIHDLRRFVCGHFQVLISRDGPMKLWHLSISHPSRYPDWDTMKEARYALLPPEITVAMYLPPKSEYVNIHNNCFHWHEVRESRIVLA